MLSCIILVWSGRAEAVTPQTALGHAAQIGSAVRRNSSVATCTLNGTAFRLGGGAMVLGSPADSAMASRHGASGTLRSRACTHAQGAAHWQI